MPDRPRPELRPSRLARALGVPARALRYLIEQATEPLVPATGPGHGRPRELSTRQAVQLALAAALFEVGLAAPAATAAAVGLALAGWELADRGGWEPAFRPLLGRLRARGRWFLDVADARAVRLATTANPEVRGLFVLPWRDLRTGQPIELPAPRVTVRIDLVQVAATVAGLLPAADPGLPDAPGPGRRRGA